LKLWVRSWLWTTNSITNDFNGLRLIEFGKKLRLSQVEGRLAHPGGAHQITQYKQPYGIGLLLKKRESHRLRCPVSAERGTD
jgi:hypothetical protein